MHPELVPLFARFLKYVEVQAGPDPCWRWTGGRSLSGRRRVRYPALFWGSHVWRVNRLVLVLTEGWILVGELPGAATSLAAFDTLEACCWAINRALEHLDASHTCDQAWCVNPGHLTFEGHRENVQRQKARQRSAVAEEATV